MNFFWNKIANSVNHKKMYQIPEDLATLKIDKQNITMKKFSLLNISPLFWRTVIRFFPLFRLLENKWIKKKTNQIIRNKNKFWLKTKISCLCFTKDTSICNSNSSSSSSTTAKTIRRAHADIKSWVTVKSLSNGR